MEGTEDESPRADDLHIGIDNFGTPDWGSEIEAEFLYAWPGNNNGLGTKANTIENNSSIVLRLQYGEAVFLFMGDAEGKDREDDPDPPRRSSSGSASGDRQQANGISLAQVITEARPRYQFQ